METHTIVIRILTEVDNFFSFDPMSVERVFRHTVDREWGYRIKTGSERSTARAGR